MAHAIKHYVYIVALVIASALLLTPALYADWNFKQIIPRTEQIYGPASADALQRILNWQRLIESEKKDDEKDQLKRVNQFFNDNVRFLSDQIVWHQEDYWATPIEALRKGAGDCEDYAIAKYMTLRQLGVPSEKLRITYVKAIRLNQAHMVVTYYTDPSAVPLVLDNLTGNIELASQRTDLIPVYAFNG
ncbi:MAG: hypothetical protein XXXJIFNMEKO3_03370 [Candidatus Erwinia impunctatus]|nr:hypothetical protein XXXJIFNMEKO_03370 [Culicoides impunctatus]